MDRRQAISRMFAGLAGTASLSVPSFAYAKPSTRDLQGLTLDAKITDLKTGLPIGASIKYLTPEEFKTKYGLDITDADTNKPQKIGVEISSNGYVTYATAGYLDSVTGTVFLQNQYGDNERVLIPENDLIKETFDVICRKNITGSLTKHPDLKRVKYEIKAQNDSPEAKYAEDILIDSVRRTSNKYVQLPSGIFVRNPNLTKPTSLTTAPLDTFQLFPDPTLIGGTGVIRNVPNTNGFYTMVQLPYINSGWIARIREEIFGGLGMSGEPGRETNTPDLEEKIAQLGGIIFGGDKSSIKADDPTVSELAVQVIKLFSTRPLGNRKYPLNVKFPELYDFDPGDFNKSGSVDFDDFFSFAEVFGTKKGHTLYNSIFDLDNDGEIGFTDFFKFAENFGKKR